ncbi:SusF/SusE family outer membrane protein [Flavitalea flava]
MQINKMANLLLAPVFVLLLFVACKKTENFSPLPVNNPLVLSAVDSVLVLNQADQYNPGLTLNWTTGSNHGTSSSISYLVKIDKKGNGFNTAIIADMGKNIFSLVYKTGVLNDSLLDHWHFTPGTAAQLEAKIVAIIGDGSHQPDTSGILNLTITPYTPVSKSLYIIGDATSTGWDLTTAGALTPDPAIPGLFHYQVTLTPGDFKFITTLGSLLPSYNKGADSSKLVWRKSAADPDNTFAITSTAVYAISVNLIEDTINVHPLALSPYSKLWIVGDATPNGWNIDHPNEFFLDPVNSFLFKFNAVLKTGEFKIPVTTGNWGADFYRPLINHPAITDTTVQFVPHGPSPADANDYKWNITTAGPYKIKLNLQYPSITITPFTPYPTLWMVGDATPTGWNINNPTILILDPANPYLFTYNGPMNVGEFKIPVRTGDFGCDYFRPYMNHPIISDTTAQFVPAGMAVANTDDYKWNITAAGTYMIIFNQLTETISIQKQ